MNSVPNVGQGGNKKVNKSSKMKKMEEEAQKLQRRKIEQQKKQMAQQERAEFRTKFFLGNLNEVKADMDDVMNRKSFVGIMNIDQDFSHEGGAVTAGVCLTYLIDPKYEQETSQES